MAAQLVFWAFMAILFGIALANPGLIWLAVIVAIVWVGGFIYRPRGGRWYYW